MKNHKVANLFGIDISTMRALSLNVIPGVISVETTPTTHKTGHWKILTSSPLTHTAIGEINAQIQVQPQSFPDVRLTWQHKPIESTTVANQNAWLNQNKDFTATLPPKPNAWLRHNIRTIHTKPTPTKANDKSTSTLNTTSSNRKELGTIQQMLSKLQSAEVENKKMRNSFAAYRAKKCQNTVQTKSDIDLISKKWINP